MLPTFIRGSGKSDKTDWQNVNTHKFNGTPSPCSWPGLVMLFYLAD
jgi:hypothetical protein